MTRQTIKNIKALNRSFKANQFGKNNTQELRHVSIDEELRTNPYLVNKYTANTKEQRINKMYQEMKSKTKRSN